MLCDYGVCYNMFAADVMPESGSLFMFLASQTFLLLGLFLLLLPLPLVPLPYTRGCLPALPYFLLAHPALPLPSFVCLYPHSMALLLVLALPAPSPTCLCFIRAYPCLTFSCLLLPPTYTFPAPRPSPVCPRPSCLYTGSRPRPGRGLGPPRCL